MREMSRTLRSAFERVIGRENRRLQPRAGRLEDVDDFGSPFFGGLRRITVYLPPGYDERIEQRYPVLYMQDGQNLFDPGRAFIRGQHWRVRETADAAISARTMRPAIVVGIDNAGERRIDEYTPDRDESRNAGGGAPDYGRMLVEDAKPMIDARFRTLADAPNTAVAGSSLGGLLALHLALTRPDVFGSAAVLSPSVWWNGRSILALVDSFEGVRPRLWLDVGLREGREEVDDVRTLRSRLAAKGWNDSNLRFYEDRRGDHSERAWAGRLRKIMEFLFPAE